MTESQEKLCTVWTVVESNIQLRRDDLWTRDDVSRDRYKIARLGSDGGGVGIGYQWYHAYQGHCGYQVYKGYQGFQKYKEHQR